MKFCIGIKYVPDVSASLRIQDGALIHDTGRMVLDAYSASAVEAALQLSEAGEGTVDVVTVGPEQSAEALRKALAMGADRAVHLVVDQAETDAWTYSALLAEHLSARSWDVILCGKQAQDTDAGLTGPMLAERLGLPYATNAVDLSMAADGTGLVVTRQTDAGQQVIEMTTPCLVTCSNDMNDPRIPNVRGIMQAKRKTIDRIECTVRTPPKTTVVGYEAMPERKAGPKLQGDPHEMARELRDRLERDAVV